MASQEEQQRKRESATAYDYDADPRWSDYWSNVLLPSHLGTQPEVLRHFKFKFYQRYIDSDLHVEPLATVTSSRSSASAARQTPSSPQQRTYVGGDRRHSAPPPANSMLRRMDQQYFQFFANAWVTIMAILALVPFASFTLLDRAYRLAFLGTAVTCLHSVVVQYGMPRTWNIEGIRAWLQSVVAGKDFLYILFSIAFITPAFPLKVAAVPILCRSLEQVAYYLRRNFSNTQIYRNYLEQPCVWLITNTNTLRTVSSNSEIGIGFLLIFLLLTVQRNIIQTFIYWQLLKLMYHAPTTAGYHRSSWNKIGMHANPFVQRYARFLEGPIGFGRRWFQG